MLTHPISLRGLTHRIHNRSRIVAAEAYLSLRWKFNRGTFWTDFDCIKLPFHGDGDRQEVYYFLDAKWWWKKELGEFSRYIREGDVVVDVGANLGFYSGIFSNLTGAKGHVHSFEPSPLVYSRLLEVIAENGYRNISPHNLGCGKEEQSMMLFCGSSSGNGTLRPDTLMEQSARTRQTIRIVSLSDFLGPKLDRLNFLKIDTEGFEDEVLAGAVGLLQRFKPVVYLEMSAKYLAQSENAARILYDLGYKFQPELKLESAALGDNFFALPPGS
jgi:FkbM family methyltransferase